MTDAALIVAAGMSSRMGDFKPMLNIGSISIAQRVVATFQQAGVEKIVMITGYNAIQLEKHLSGLGIVDALFIMLVGNIASLVPVPGGFGAYHFMVSSAMSFVYGIPAGFGMIFATLSHEAQTLTQIVSGGLSYISETVRK